VLFVQAGCIYESGNNFIGHYYQEKILYSVMAAKNYTL
jgi:hypothetical protein